MPLQFQADDPQPVTDAELSRLSRLLSADIPGFRLDAAYEEFLSRHHKQELVECTVPLSDDSTMPIDLFLTFDRADGVDSVVGFWNAIEDRINEFLVPFAITPGNDAFCFDYEGFPDESIRVVLWLHEKSEEDAPFTVPVAESFSEFLQLVK
ncbi:MAG: SMI1/KNR4 family protein [Planctomycetaceae bacterium]